MSGADHFLPVFIYVIVKARPRRLFSTIDWVMSFRRPERLCGERECCPAPNNTAAFSF